MILSLNVILSYDVVGVSEEPLCGVAVVLTRVHSTKGKVKTLFTSQTDSRQTKILVGNLSINNLKIRNHRSLVGSVLAY